ncbi:hypothetical protein HPB51_026560 [Rhipicephalus microplus]|uniref:Uncharacterized protein n=1 Tax=Rhipicephalus microplus TaxID=6941 RepID=A0A9J6D2R3_RHIMP|nr:hypothetical protein HPB51_026560 [Rhipicephalus microplus]
MGGFVPLESWRLVPEPVLVPLVVESWRRVPEPALAPLFQEGWRGFPRRTTGAQGHNSPPPEHVSRRLQFVDSGAEPLEFDAATLRLPTSSLQVTTPPIVDFATECCRRGINDGPGYYPDDLNYCTMDLEKLAAIGLQLGFSGAELNKWIEAQQAKLRDERAAEREAAKEADERQREILQLKLKLQEGAQNMPESWRLVPEPVLVPLVVESWRRVPEPALAPLFQEGWRGFPRRTTGAQGHNSPPPEHVSRRLQFVDSGAEPLEFDAATLRLPTWSLQVTTPPIVDFATECCRRGINDGPGYYPDDLNWSSLRSLFQVFFYGFANVLLHGDMR